jgi:hypothetical protein
MSQEKSLRKRAGRYPLPPVFLQMHRSHRQLLRMRERK